MEFILKHKVMIILILVILIAVGIYVYNMQFLNEKGQDEMQENSDEKSYIENLLDINGGKKDGKIIVHVTGAVKKTGVVILDEGARIYEAIEKSEGSLENADLSMLNLAYMLEDGQKLYIPFKGDIIEEGSDGETIGGGIFRNSENNDGNNDAGSEIRNSENANSINSENGIRDSENTNKSKNQFRDSENNTNTSDSNIRNSGNNTGSSGGNIRDSGKVKKIITSDFSDSGNMEYENTTVDKTSKVNINTAKQTELETLPGIGTVTAGKIIEYRNKNGKFKNIEDLKNISGIGDAKFEKIKEYICIK